MISFAGSARFNSSRSIINAHPPRHRRHQGSEISQFLRAVVRFLVILPFPHALEAKISALYDPSADERF
jgi:hypothetical protein